MDVTNFTIFQICERIVGNRRVKQNFSEASMDNKTGELLTLPLLFEMFDNFLHHVRISENDENQRDEEKRDRAENFDFSKPIFGQK